MTLNSTSRPPLKGRMRSLQPHMCQWLTVQEYAQTHTYSKLGQTHHYSEQGVRMLIYRQRVEAKKFKGKWYIRP